MELYAKGQLSYLILTCLQGRDFYGLDIISEISSRSNNRINLKKPSVYSNLTRMEKQGYISAYLQSSDFGPNRKYYSLTEKGRNFYKELQEYFERNNIDVFRDFVDPDSPAPQAVIEDTSKEANQLQEDLNRTQTSSDDFFDFSSIESDNQTVSSEEDTAQNIEDELNMSTSEEDAVENKETLEEVKVEDNKEVLASERHEETRQVEKTENTFSIKNALMRKEEIKEEEKDIEAIEAYNKRLYDISKDINKYKRQRSFAEDQISMTAPSTPLSETQEKSKSNIEEFKNSFLENKNKYQTERLSNLDFSRYTNPRRTMVQEKPSPIVEEKNDAVFITKRIDASEIERPKRIEPPKIKISQSDNFKDNKLPAPKRDLTIDPSHKEILTKLYSKTKDGSVEEVREDALYDFDDLKKFYEKQNISFNEYKKPAEKIKHNTNKIALYVSLFTFILASGFSAVLYAILNHTLLINNSTNFLFILLPALLVVDVVWKLYNFLKYKSWLPSQMIPQWQIWALFLIISGLIVCLNFICGLGMSNFSYYATSLILPLILAFIIMPIRYYIKRFALIKYWE